MYLLIPCPEISVYCNLEPDTDKRLKEDETATRTPSIEKDNDDNNNP